MIGKPFSVDWQKVLHACAPFSQLSDQDLNKLIQQDAKEVDFAPDETIVKEGERASHLYVVGRGSVSVVLSRPGGRLVRLATLRIGEIFGEMGLIEEKPRMATVIADEDCILLKIDGQRFLERLHSSPDLEFKMLLTMSERLRSRTEHIFSERLAEADDRLAAFHEQLKTELRISAATKQATQAMFDETHKRASEVIQSFERTRAYFTWIGSALSAFVVLVVTIGGIFGVGQFLKVKEFLADLEYLEEKTNTTVEKMEADIDNASVKFGTMKKQTLLIEENIRNSKETIENIERLAPRPVDLGEIFYHVNKLTDNLETDMTIAIKEINKEISD